MTTGVITLPLDLGLAACCVLQTKTTTMIAMRNGSGGVSFRLLYLWYQWSDLFHVGYHVEFFKLSRRAFLKGAAQTSN